MICSVVLASFYDTFYHKMKIVYRVYQKIPFKRKYKNYEKQGVIATMFFGKNYYSLTFI